MDVHFRASLSFFWHRGNEWVKNKEIFQKPAIARQSRVFRFKQQQKAQHEHE